jgi:Na+/H+ antiporter NhaB
VPQYDIVSGGVAAIFAGFLGFLICEKFGFELLDSGDFYFLFMYLVFGIFFIRLLIKTLNNEINN